MILPLYSGRVVVEGNSMALKLALAVLASCLPMTALAAEADRFDLICAGEGWTEFKGMRPKTQDISVDLKSGDYCFLPCRPGEAQPIQSVSPERLVFYEDVLGASRMTMAFDRKTMVFRVESTAGQKVLRIEILTCEPAPFSPFLAKAD